jgi:hypothetical protein
MKIDLCGIFGVKPDQVFGVKGEEYTGEKKYRVHDNVLQWLLIFKSGTWDTSRMEVNELLKLEIIRYPATEVEKTILVNLSEKYRKNGYIARDKNGVMYIFESCPAKYVWGYGCSYMTCFNLPYPHLFSYIQFETGAVPVKDIIGE